MIRQPFCLLPLLAILLFTACEKLAPAPAQEEKSAAGVAGTPPVDVEPPRPPIMEDFEGQPQLSLFPRVGDYRPPRGDERHPFWETFIDHLVKTSGRARGGSEDKPNHAWSFRSIKSIDSTGYFAPIAVKPKTTYRVSARMMTDLPEGGIAGIGVVEFNEFSLEGQQYDQETVEKLFVNAQVGVQMEGKTDFDTEQSFTFTTKPETRMLHLILYREGEHNRMPVMFDDISVVTWVEDKGEVEKVETDK